MKKSRQMTRELFDHKGVLLGAMLMVSALFLTTKASAAPATPDKSKATVRTTTTALDPVTLRPAWISRISAAKPVGTTAAVAPIRPTTPAVTSIGPRLGGISVQSSAAAVRVPVRPQGRSPWLPPSQWQ